VSSSSFASSVPVKNDIPLSGSKRSRSVLPVVSLAVVIKERKLDDDAISVDSQMTEYATDIDA
jgi:hypothetical protein